MNWIKKTKKKQSINFQPFIKKQNLQCTFTVKKNQQKVHKQVVIYIYI